MTSRKGVCPICEKEFETTRPNKKCCSEKCRRRNSHLGYYPTHKAKYLMANKKYYAAHREQEKARCAGRVQSLRGWIDEIKTKSKCSKCGEARPVCLEFHHTDPSGKVGGALKGTVSYLLKANQNRERILEELEKCVVLCRNCHAVEHWKQKK